MSFTFTVLYNANKKVFKSVSPSTILQQLVTEAVEHFKLPANSSCQLKFRRTVLDLSQPVRFSNLPNNAQLDLNVSSSSVSGSCRVAISVIGKTDKDRVALTDSFPDHFNLATVLQRFVDQEKLPSNLFDRSPEVVLMRASFSNNSLTHTTLTSLGLSGQSVRFQLRYFENGEVVGKSDTPVVSTSSPPLNEVVVEVGEVVVVSPQPASSPFNTTSAVTPPSHSIEQPSHSAPPLRGVEEVSKVDVETMETETMTSERSEEESRVSVSEAVEGILCQNFDVVSRGAVVALAKYLLNILLHPHPTRDSKYHVIKLDNKVLREKILPAQSALAVLTSVGFREDRERGVLVVVPDVENLQRVEEAVPLLQRAMDTLDIPENDRPFIPPLPIVTSPTPAPDFDPFKTLVIRPQGLPGPTSAATSQPSNTEVQVEQLKRKRAELEGNPSEILHNTRVFLPRSDSDVSAMSDSKDRQGGAVVSEDSGDVSGADSGVRRAMMQKILRREREGEEGKPLTTSAIRELQKLQSEKVYSETVVRVRFPDKVEVVAHFHPRHTLKEVYLWLLDLLHLQPQTETQTEEEREVESTEVSERRRVLQAMDLFALYISPPKTSLLPAKVKSHVTQHNHKTFVQWNEADLLSLGLVPAAILSLTWHKPPLSPGHGQGSGFYLKEDLLTSAIAASLSSVSLPQGRTLLTDTGSDVAGANSGVAPDKEKTQVTSSQSDSSKKVTSSGSGKPKWFKL